MADDIQLATLEAIAADATVTALTTKAYTGGIPQSITLPAYVVDVVSNNATEHLAGSALSTARVRINAYGTTPTEANTLAEAIRTEVMKANHKGSFGVANAMNVRDITLAAGPFRDRDAPVDGSDEFRPFVTADYFVTYKQTGPS